MASDILLEWFTFAGGEKLVTVDGRMDYAMTWNKRLGIKKKKKKTPDKARTIRLKKSRVKV